MANAPPASQPDITQGGLLSKLMQHGSVYFIANAILNFTGLLLLPVNTRLFSESEYGAISTIDAGSRMLWVLTSLYLSSAFARFYHEYKQDPVQLRRYTSTIYWFMMAWGVLAVTVVLLFLRQFFVVADVPVWPVLTLAFCVPVLMQIGQIGADYLRQTHRSMPNVTLSIGNVFLHVVIMLALVGGLGLGLTGKYIGLVGGALFFAAGGTWILLRDGLLEPSISMSLLKESLLFALPLVPEAASGWLTGFSDRLLLSWYGPMSETGIYSVGYTLGKGISMFGEAVYMVYGPLVFAMMKKDMVMAKVRLERFGLYFFIFMAWVFLTLTLFAREAVALLAPSEYSGAAPIVVIVMFGYLLSSQYKLFIAILNYQRLTWAISSGALLMAVTNLGANLLLIPHFGKLAAAWTTVLALAIYLIWMYFWAQRSFHLDFDYRRLLLAAFIIGAFWMFNTFMSLFLFSTLSAWVQLSLKLLLLAIATLAIWVSGCILPLDRQQILVQIRSLNS